MAGRGGDREANELKKLKKLKQIFTSSVIKTLVFTWVVFLTQWSFDDDSGC